MTMICLAGLAMGWINNIAGAAGALGLIAFQQFTDLDQVAVNASLRLAAAVGSVCGILGFLSKGQRIPGHLWAFGAMTLPGAVLGSVLGVELPAIVWQLTVLSVLIFVLAQQMVHPREPGVAEGQPETARWLLFVLFTWLGMHMGFVQIATGQVAMLILTVVHSRDLVQVNCAKMVVVLFAAVTSAGSYAAMGAVEWHPAALLALGSGTGSFLASRWSVRMGHEALRIVVVGICVAVLGILSWQWFA